MRSCIGYELLDHRNNSLQKEEEINLDGLKDQFKNAICDTSNRPLKPNQHAAKAKDSMTILIKKIVNDKMLEYPLISNADEAKPKSKGSSRSDCKCFFLGATQHLRSMIWNGLILLKS